MTLVAGSFDPLQAEPWFRMEVQPGLSVREILARYPGLPSWFDELGSVRIDGVEVERANWSICKPMQLRRSTGAPVVVTLHPPAPQGDRAKQAFAIVATLLLAVATAGIAGGALGPAGLGLLGESFAAGHIGANLLAAGVGLAGQMAIRALTPPPVAPNISAPETKVQAGITANAYDPLGRLSAVLGRMVHSPKSLIQPFSTIHGQDGDLRVHTIVGCAGRHLVENVQVNGINANDLPGVTYQIREGKPDDPALTLNSTIAVEDRAQILLSSMKLAKADDKDIDDQATPANSEPKWHIVKSRGTFKRCTLRLQFPAGLSYNSNDGPEAAGIPVRLGFRKKGDVTWKNGPEFHFERGKTVTGIWRREISIERGTVPSGALVALTPDADSQQRRAYRVAGTSPFQYTADAYFNQGGSAYAAKVARTEEGFRVYLDSATFDEGEYEFRIMRGQAYEADEFADNYVYRGSGSNAHFFVAVDTGGGDWEAADTHQKYVSECYLETVLTETDDYPFGSTGNVTLISVTAEGVQVNSISATFTRYAPIWSNGNWATVAPTRNPAALFRHVAIGSDNPNPFDLELIDPGNLEAWYDACEAAGYTFDAVIDGLSVMQILQMAASAGWAVPRQAGELGVIRDIDRSAEPIEQKFTPLTSADLRVRRDWPELPHAIRGQFYDEDDGYKLRDTYVYADGYDRDTATRIAVVNEIGLTNRTRVRNKLLFYLRQMYRRARVYTLQAGAQVMRSRRGSLVGITNDVISLHHAFSVVKAVVTSGTVPNVMLTGLQLKFPVDMSWSSGLTPGAALTLKNGQEVLARLQPEAGETDVLTFHTPFPLPVDLARNCIVSIGQIGQEYRRCIIQNITFEQRDLAGELTLLDEAPEIHADGCIAPAEEDPPGIVIGSAWAHVGESAPVTASSGNLVLTEPAGVAEGDHLVAFIGFTETAGFTAPAGWEIAEQMLNEPAGFDGGRSSIMMAWRRRGSTAGSLTFTRSGGGPATGVIVAFRGGAVADALDDSSSGLAGVGSFGETITWSTIPEVAAAFGDELVVLGAALVSSGSGSPSLAAIDPTPDLWTRRVLATPAGGTGLCIYTAVKRTAGGTGGLAVKIVAPGAQNAHAAACFRSLYS